MSELTGKHAQLDKGYFYSHCLSSSIGPDMAFFNLEVSRALIFFLSSPQT